MVEAILPRTLIAMLITAALFFAAKNVLGEQDGMLIRVLNLEQAKVPEGAVVFLKSDSCPKPWVEFEDARGRYIVALNAEGTLGFARGQALNDKENRNTGAHKHPVDTQGSHTHGTSKDGRHFHGTHRYTLSDIVEYGQVGTNTISQARTGIVSHEYTTHRDAGHKHSIKSNGKHKHTANPHSNHKNGTNAPYIQLLACILDSDDE